MGKIYNYKTIKVISLILICLIIYGDKNVEAAEESAQNITPAERELQFCISMIADYKHNKTYVIAGNLYFKYLIFRDMMAYEELISNNVITKLNSECVSHLAKIQAEVKQNPKIYGHEFSRKKITDPPTTDFPLSVDEIAQIADLSPMQHSKLNLTAVDLELKQTQSYLKFIIDKLTNHWQTPFEVNEKYRLSVSLGAVLALNLSRSYLNYKSPSGINTKMRINKFNAGIGEGCFIGVIDLGSRQRLDGFSARNQESHQKIYYTYSEFLAVMNATSFSKFVIFMNVMENSECSIINRNGKIDTCGGVGAGLFLDFFSRPLITRIYSNLNKKLNRKAKLELFDDLDVNSFALMRQ